jgi:hypothetical protein
MDQSLIQDEKMASEVVGNVPVPVEVFLSLSVVYLDGLNLDGRDHGEVLMDGHDDLVARHHSLASLVDGHLVGNQNALVFHE